MAMHAAASQHCASGSGRAQELGAGAKESQPAQLSKISYLEKRLVYHHFSLASCDTTMVKPNINYIWKTEE